MIKKSTTRGFKQIYIYTLFMRHFLHTEELHQYDCPQVQPWVIEMISYKMYKGHIKKDRINLAEQSDGQYV